MDKAVKFLILLWVVFSITACHSFANQYQRFKERENEYKKSGSSNDLIVPPGLEASHLKDDYVIPVVSNNAMENISLLPPNSAAEQMAQGKVTEAALKQEVKTFAASSKTAITQDAATLTLNQNIDSAWDQIGKAIKTADYPIAEQDKKIMTYFILDTKATAEKVTRDTPIYQVNLQEADENTQVSLTDNDGKTVDVITTTRVLTDIHNALLGKIENSMMKWLKKHL